MKLLVDLLLAFPIGLTYSIFFHKLGEIMNSDYEYHEKIQRNLILSFIGGIVGLILIILVFGEKKTLHNRAVKYGIFVGSLLLLIHTLIYNWHILENDVKLFTIITSMMTLIWYSYYYTNSHDIQKHKKIKKIKKVKKVELPVYNREEEDYDNAIIDL